VKWTIDTEAGLTSKDEDGATQTIPLYSTDGFEEPSCGRRLNQKHVYTFGLARPADHPAAGRHDPDPGGAAPVEPDVIVEVARPRRLAHLLRLACSRRPRRRHRHRDPAAQPGGDEAHPSPS
jgi:hypothetical protein